MYHRILALFCIIYFSVASVASPNAETPWLQKEDLVTGQTLNHHIIPGVTNTQVYRYIYAQESVANRKVAAEMTRLNDFYHLEDKARKDDLKGFYDLLGGSVPDLMVLEGLVDTHNQKAKEKQAYLLQPEIFSPIIQHGYGKKYQRNWLFFSYDAIDVLAEINGLHVIIKQLSADNTYDTVHEHPVENGRVVIMLHTMAGTEGGFCPGENQTLNHFNRLSLHRGVIRSPIITYKDVRNVNKSKSTSVGVSASPGGAIPGTASFSHNSRNTQTDTLSTISSNFYSETNSDISGINGDAKNKTKKIKDSESNMKAFVLLANPMDIPKLWDRAVDNFNGTMDKPLMTPKQEVTQLAVLKKADQEMIDEGISEEDRSKVFEDSDLTDAIQISDALKKAQEEKIIRMTREKEAAEQNTLQTSEESRGMELSEIREAIQNESFKLTPIEINQALENLSLVRMSRNDDGGVQFECHALPVDERSTIAHTCLSFLGLAHEKTTELAATNPGAASVIMESIQKGLEAVDISGYIRSGAAGATAGVAYGSASVNPAGITVGGIVGMIGGVLAYHQTKAVVEMIFEAGTESAVDAARDQGRTPEESDLFGESVASGLFVGSLLTGKGKGGKVKKGDLARVANSNKTKNLVESAKTAEQKSFHDSVNYTNVLRDFNVGENKPALNSNRVNLHGLDLASGKCLLSTDLSKNVRAYLRDMENRSGIPFSDLQKSELKEAVKNNKFEKLDPLTFSIHGDAFTRSQKGKMQKEWGDLYNQDWPSNSRDLKTPSGGKHSRAGHKDDLHHIIPQEVGGPHTWWNSHPLKAGDQHQGGVHGSGSPLNEILQGTKK